jgi:F-type H+-transporting ATPase subunit gamma
MVAASKMRKAQNAALAGRPFMRELYFLQRRATMQEVSFEHPLLEQRDVRKRAVILVASDKGLCGALNTNVFRIAEEFDRPSTLFLAAGRKAAQFVTRSGFTLASEFPYADSPRYPEAMAIANAAKEMFLNSTVDEVRIVATQFNNTLSQQAVNISYLPIGAVTGLPVQEDPLPLTDYLFEPDPRTVWERVLGNYLNVYLYQVLLNAKASEQSARMVAMKNATENAEHLIDTLTLDYNKLRQGNITNELLDIAGGQADNS